MLTAIPGEKLVIVNADDFGYSAGVNQGILQAHEKGIVTSTSVMVRWPDADETRSLLREHPGLSVGLHLDLGEWVFRDGRWVLQYTVLPESGLESRPLVEQEVWRQLDLFRKLADRNPT